MLKLHLALCAAAVLVVAATGRAQETSELETLRIVVGQPGAWSVSGPALGQQAGLFRKHGLALEFVDAARAGRPAHAVISGAADLAIGVGTPAVLRAYAKGAPVRVIGANFTGAGDLYWYARADSSIRRLDDVTDKTTVGFSANGSPSQNVVLAFIQELNLRGLPIPTGTSPATLSQVMLGRVDVGWAAAPFGLKEVAEDKIRIVANGNDAPSLRTQTVRVDLVNAHAWKSRRDTFIRFVRAYRETLDWMFSSAQAVAIYAQQSKIAPELVALMRDKFQTRQAMRNDRLSDLNAIMADAVALKFLDKPLNKAQVAELVQIPPRQQADP